MYCADLHGNQIELQVDNYDKLEEAGKFLYRPALRCR